MTRRHAATAAEPTAPTSRMRCRLDIEHSTVLPQFIATMSSPIASDDGTTQPTSNANADHKRRGISRPELLSGGEPARKPIVSSSVPICAANTVRVSTEHLPAVAPSPALRLS